MELINTYTHLIPFILFAAKFLVYIKEKKYILALYGGSLLICYGTSSIYHYNNFINHYSKTLNKLDHTGIYVLLAGSYFTVCWPQHRKILEQVLTLSLFFSILLWVVELPATIKVLTYMSIGWFGIRSLNHPKLIVGGLFYTAGGIIYSINYDYHWIFHIFVFWGSLCHLSHFEETDCHTAIAAA